jgi:NAD(P)-dependent dehydrogenase (short-subunit alcohol dehydrogenase family)
MGRFDGKRIVITGGGAGLGRECALLWSSEGGQVVVSDLVEQRAVDLAAEINTKGGRAEAIKADVTNESEVAAAVDLAVSAFGGLDIMYANAGKGPAGYGSIGLEDFTEEQWDDVNDVVYKGVFFSGKHACRVMKGSGNGGNIVVTISAGGLNQYPGFGAYCAGKSGCIGLVKAMATDWGRYGIRVNALAPTHGMSPNFAMPSDAPVIGMSYEEYALQQEGATWDPYTRFAGPLKVNRPPSLRDNAAVATFLASDDSAYMSGITIPSCDGGNFARTSIPIPENWTLDDQISF